MPQLAVNDTLLSRRLLRAGRLEVDFFETSGPLTDTAADLAPAGVPLLLHNGVWNWSLGDPGALAEPGVLRETRRRLALTGAPWLSVHLGFSAARVTFESGMRPASPVLPRPLLLETVARNLRALQRALGVPVLVENLDYTPTGAYEHVCEPDFIAEVLAATGTGLLLDLAHAQVSASRLGYPVEAYLKELPLERLEQLHISGPRPADAPQGALVDAHEPLREADYRLLSDLLGRTTPRVLTLEYGRHEGALLEQLTRLRRLLA